MAAATFSFPTLVEFGPGALSSLPGHVLSRGQRALLVTDPGVRALPLFDEVVRVLTGGGVAFEVLSDISPNPIATECEAGGAIAREAGCDVIIGLGGGSALDGAKGVALMATHEGPILGYDDALGGWERIRDDVPPILAIATTAGTGSEVGRSTVVVDPETHRKIVVFSPHLMPAVAISDPELMVGMPPWLTAATGFDALTHNLEALSALGYHPMADGIALEGLSLCGRWLVRATEEGSDLEARGGMAMAAMMGATAFQKGLGAAHSLAHPLGTLAGMHHGLANAIVLPYVVAFNRQGSRAAREAYGLVERRLGLAQPLETWLVELRERLGIAHDLAGGGADPGMLEALSAQAFQDACHTTNPRPCTEADLSRLYSAALAGDLDAART